VVDPVSLCCSLLLNKSSADGISLLVCGTAIKAGNFLLFEVAAVNLAASELFGTFTSSAIFLGVVATSSLVSSLGGVNLSTEMDPTILKDSVVSVATGVVVVVDVVVVEAVVVEILSSLPNNGISLTEGRVDKGIGRSVVTPDVMERIISSGLSWELAADGVAWGGRVGGELVVVRVGG